MQNKIIDKMIESDNYLEPEKLNELYLFEDAEKWLQRKIIKCSSKEIRKSINL